MTKIRTNQGGDLAIAQGGDAYALCRKEAIVNENNQAAFNKSESLEQVSISGSKQGVG